MDAMLTEATPATEYLPLFSLCWFTKRTNRPLAGFLLMVVCLSWPTPLLPQATSERPQDKAGDSPLSAEQIAHNLAEKNAARSQALESYGGTRHYSLDYSGFPSHLHAELVVEMKFMAPSTKEFTILSQSGSKLLIDKVLKRLLESEKEAAANRDQTELTEKNYRFSLVEYVTTPSGPQYVMEVEPRVENKFLYRGKVWIDGKDFAVTKIEAQPAKNPSFWTKRTEIHHVYAKIGDFWLPAENQTSTSVRMGGHSSLSIQYNDYKILSARPLPD